MTRLRFRIAMSVDGFTSGPNQSVQDPLGVGGMRLHEWAIGLAAWRAPHGMTGGEVNASSAVVEESLRNVGATIMGRNMFGGHPGPWRDWDGWWGKNPPFHHPVFVITHHARPPLELEGGNVFTFVTDGIHAALERARAAAGGKDVNLAGGATVARQFLNEGLVDDMELSLAPVFLGGGERLFEGTGAQPSGLRHVRTVDAPGVTHLRFLRRGTVLASDREVVTVRHFRVPRERLFDAWTDPAALARWWGPRGFTNRFERHEPREGGEWRFVMRGPDGKEYRNHSVYEDVTRPQGLAFHHRTGPSYRARVRFDEERGGTTLEWRMRFDNPEFLAQNQEIVLRGNEDNLDKLEEVLGG